MKPILFNTEMVKAILSGRKTVTRRIVKPQPPENARLELVGDRRHAVDLSIDIPGPDDHRIYTPPYLPGDILYVRETWAKLYYVDADGYTHYDQPMYYYAADGEPDITLIDPDGFEEDDQHIRWRPSIHMPKEAARIFMRVTNVHVERLIDSFQKTGDVVSDFAAEGVDLPDECETCLEAYGNPCCNDLNEALPYDDATGEDSNGGSECGMLEEVIQSFADLWDSTIKPDNLSCSGFSANPWVWVIEFERCEKPEEAQP